MFYSPDMSCPSPSSVSFDSMSSLEPLSKKECPQFTSIDELPIHVVQSILDRIPLHDAIRTSVLSKQWRYKWKYLSRLVFDQEFYCYVRCCSGSSNYHQPSDYITSIINTLLLSQEGRIHELYFYFPYRLCQHDPNAVEHWIRFAARNGVSNLTLEKYEVNYNEIELPVCLFSCSSLTHLSLYYFSIRPPLSFTGFPRLTSLKLKLFNHDLNRLEGLISACPELRVLDMRTSPDDYLSSPSPIYLCVSAPKLKSLVFKSSAFLRLCGATTNITRASLKMLHLKHQGVLDTVELLRSLCNVEVLRLNFHYCELLFYQGVIPHKLPLLLSRLKKLTIRKSLGTNLLDFNQILLAVCLIRSSPNLQHLDLFVNSPCDECHHHELELNEDCSLGCLRTVKIRCIRDLCLELKVIKFILACSPVLEVMFIDLCGRLKKCKDTKLMKELGQFRRVSPKVEIIFM